MMMIIHLSFTFAIIALIAFTQMTLVGSNKPPLYYKKPNDLKSLNYYVTSFGQTLELSDEKIFQILGNVIMTIKQKPLLVKHKTMEITRSLDHNGYHIAKYIKDAVNSAIVKSNFVKVVVPKINMLQNKLEKKCNYNQDCIDRVFVNFLDRIVKRFSIMSSVEQMQMFMYLYTSLSNIKAKREDIFENLTNLFLQCFSQFIKNSDLNNLFDNLIDNIIPQFIRKTILLFDYFDIKNLFTELFDIIDSNYFENIISIIIGEFSNAIN